MAMKWHAEAKSAQLCTTRKEAVPAARTIAQNSSRPRQVVAIGTDGRLLEYLNFGLSKIQEPRVKVLRSKKQWEE